MSFSERIGLRKPRETIQLSSMDVNLKIAIYNYLHKMLLATWYNHGNCGGRGNILAERVWGTFWKKTIDNFPDAPYTFCEQLKKFIVNAEWNDVYELMEFIIQNGNITRESAFNSILEQECSGYRVRKGIIVPISDKIELETLDTSLQLDDKFSGARTHLKCALEHLSQRPKPDFRNAITEAISAVESSARIVTGMKKATLADAIKTLGKNATIHPCLKDAWLKLYGYTSDEDGLRHAMIEEPNIDYATAKYMIITCAAFVNMLAESN